MRTHVPSYELVIPKNLDEALLKLEDPKSKPFAGGTDLMVLFEAGELPLAQYVSLWGLKELKEIEVLDDFVSIGALATFSNIRCHPVISLEYPMLTQAARETGAIAIQNRGSLGGNIANASPAADAPPALLAYDAELELISRRGKRFLPYHRFHLGYKKTDLKPDEIIRAIHLPRRPRHSPSHLSETHYFRKVGTRGAQAISKVSIAAFTLCREGRLEHVRLAFGSVAPTPVRFFSVESVLESNFLDQKITEEALSKLMQEISPIDDIRSTARYRRVVAANLLKEFLRQVGLRNG